MEATALAADAIGAGKVGGSPRIPMNFANT